MTESNSPYRFQVMPLALAVDRYSEEWQSWVVRENLNISHLPKWLCCGAEALTYGHKAYTVVVSNEDECPIAFLPYRLSKRTLGGVPYIAIEVGAGLPGYHSDWLTGSTGRPLLEYLKAALVTERAHAIIISKVPDGSDTALLLSNQEAFSSVLAEEGEVSPRVMIQTDWEGYIKSKKSRFRHAIRKKMSKLDKAGNCSIKYYQKPETVSHFIDVMLEIEKDSWKATADIAVTKGGYEHQFYLSLLPYLASHDAMLGIVLWQENVPIAYSLRYIWGQEMGGMKSTYKEYASNLSPGFILQLHTMQRAFELGMSIFDFLGDSGQHKDEWANDAIAHHSYICFGNSIRGFTARLAHRTLPYVWRRRGTRRSSQISRPKIT